MSEWVYDADRRPEDGQWVKVTAMIRNNATGEVREDPTSCLLEDGIPNVYWWKDGNASCDCNRAIFFNRDDETDCDCGYGGYSVNLVNPATGKVFYREFEDGAE